MQTYNASEAIARAKQLIEEARKKAEQKAADKAKLQAEHLGLTVATAMPTAAPTTNVGLQLNAEQQMAVDYGFYRRSFCLIGAAGTGKTTTLRAVLRTLIDNYRLPMLATGTQYLHAGTPGVALISYTRRAVRNIAKQMPPELKSHCITFHKLLEYAPETYLEENEDGEWVNKMRFAPTYNSQYKLPSTLSLIVVDEASMLSIEYFEQIIAALPNPNDVQFIFLGDLNQLPPVYGIPILGKMLIELPIIELTRVYRQALESPIVSLALAVKDNNFDTFLGDVRNGTFDVTTVEGTNKMAFNPTSVASKIVIEKEGRGKITLHPWKKTLDKDDALMMMQAQCRAWIKSGEYDPVEDLILCPWNTSFGTDELNLAIADYLSQSQGLLVHEVIAGYNKHYFAIGDKLMVDKQDAIILDIIPNSRYLGKTPLAPSTKLNRWGHGSTETVNLFDENISDAAVDEMLNAMTDVGDRTNQCSHSIRVRYLDSGFEGTITQSAVINNSQFGYAITVHKAQGSECRRVFFLTHACHAAMCSRELVYTAITRAAEELYIVMTPSMLAKAAKKPRIKGDTLADKLEFFKGRIAEKHGGMQVEIEDDDN